MVKRIRPLNELDAAQVKARNESIELEIQAHEEAINNLRNERKCQYCGGSYYGKGYCVSCYNHIKQYGTLVRNGRGNRTAPKEKSFSVNLIRMLSKGKESYPPKDFAINYERVARELTDNEKLAIEKIIGEGCTQKAVAEMLGVTPQRVSELYRKALRKLQRPDNLRHLLYGFTAEFGTLVQMEDEIDVLNVDIRIKNALRRANVRTIKEVAVLLQQGNLHRIRNLGPSGVDTMTHKIANVIEGREKRYE